MRIQEDTLANLLCVTKTHRDVTFELIIRVYRFHSKHKVECPIDHRRPLKPYAPIFCRRETVPFNLNAGREGLDAQTV